MIYTAVDSIFSLFMWILLTPAGRLFFFSCDVGMIMGCLLYLSSTRNDP